MAVHATPAALARRSTNAKITASCDALAQARSPADLDRALRVLRNLVIGHGDNKLAAAIHPHVIPALCLLLVSSDGTVPMSPADPASSIGARHRTLAAVVLGSLATGTATNSSGTPPITAAVSAQGAGDIMDVDGPVTTTTMATTATTTAQSIAEAFALHSVPRALIHALSDPDSAVATAAAAALRAVYAGHVGTLASPPPAPPPPPPPSLLPPTGSALAAAAAIPKADLYAEHPVRVLVSMIVAACEDLDAGGGVGGASGKAAEAAAAVLAASCDSPRQQQLAAACGGLSAALRLLISCSSPATTAAATAAGKGGVSRSINAARTAAAATAAVAAIVRDHRDLAIEVARAHAAQGPIVNLLLENLADRDYELSLATATCLTNLCRARALGDRSAEVARTVLPILLAHIRSDVPPSIQERACLVLATLLADAEDQQNQLASSNGYALIAALITTSIADPTAAAAAPTAVTAVTAVSTPVGAAGSSAGPATVRPGSSAPRPPGTPLPTAAYAHGARAPAAARVLEAALLAAAAGCAASERARTAAVEAGLVPALVTAMRHPRVGVRAAAAQGMRSVSRSVRSIRTAAVDAGVAAPLVALLDDPAPLVQAAASAALCNLVLDFAPMKAEVIQLGGIAKLANLAKHLTAGESGRLHAVWALKNIAYNAPAATKDQTISALGWPAIRGMIEADGNPAIQEQMLNLLRNLVCGAEGDISVMFSGYNAAFGPSARGSATPGGAMLDMLVRYMDGADPELAHQALYTVVNVATGTEQHKNALMVHPQLLDTLLARMSHPKPSVRVGCVWALINLTWLEEEDPRARITALRQRGFEAQLQSMQGDADKDVRDRVAAALIQFAEHS